MEKKINLALVLILLIVITPYLYTILYALPSTDDFWMAAGVDKTNLFWDAVNTANSFWLNWGGMWLYEFLRVFLNPLVLFGATSAFLGVELEIFFLIFVGSMGILNFTFWKYVIRERKKVYVMASYLMLLIWFLNTEVWTEVFYWFVGTAYMWAMTLILLTVALEIIYFNKPRVWIGVLLSVVGAVACSFYSQAVFPCSIFLLFIGKDIYENKKINLKIIIPFVFFLIGAFSSLVAPGNFQRKDVENGVGLGFASAVKDTFVIWLGNLFDLLKNPLALIIAILFVALGMICLKEGKNRYRHPLIPFGLTLIGLFIAYFPFALGYGNATYLPNRAKFSFNMFAVLAIAVSCMYLGGWLRYEKKILLTKKRAMYGLACLMVFAYTCLIPTKYYEELPYAQTVAQIHQVKLANEQWRYLLDRIEGAEEENVVFERSVINTPIIKSPGITSDKDNSINKNIADFYEKESVCVYWW